MVLSNLLNQEKAFFRGYIVVGFAFLVTVGTLSCKDSQSENNRTLFLVTVAGTLQFDDGVVDLQQVIPKVLTGIGEEGKGVHFIAWVQKKQIYVNTTIFDTLGNVLGIMHRNQWITNADGILDRNFDENAIEVRNNVGQIIFQIEIVGNYVKMRGKFHRKNARSIIIFSEVNGQGNERTNVMLGWPQWIKKVEPIYNFNFSPNFKYPSHAYMGQRSQ